MKLKTVRLDDLTRSILLRSRIEGKSLFLPGQLPRDEYTRVAKAIEAAGGKWNKKSGCHLFPNDVRETLNIGEDTVSVTHVQQSFQAFDTPGGVASQMMVEADLTAGDKVLEPSAGTGNLILAAMSHGVFASDITAVEIDERKAKQLKCGKVVVADFLACNGELGKFDRVLMNPPFSRGDDIRHILHARTFLDEGGRLVAICANGPKQHEALEPICDHWIDLPDGSFQSEGTNVCTAIIVING